MPAGGLAGAVVVVVGCVVGAVLVAGDAAQLKVGVGFGGIDGYGVLESLNGRRILTSLLVNESQLILRLGVVRIDGRRVQHAPEILPAAQSGTHVAEFAAEKVKRIKQKEGRGQPSENESERRPKENRGGERNHGQQNRTHRDPVLRSENGAHRKKHQHREVEAGERRNRRKHRRRSHHGGQGNRDVHSRPGHRGAS